MIFTNKGDSLTSEAEAFAAIYALLEVDRNHHFIFTSSGAEAVNHAVFSAYLDITRKSGRNHFISASIDEAPAIMAMSRLSELGCVHEMAPADHQGIVSAKAIGETITPRTAMVSVSWANGLTGVVQPVEEIAALCRDRGILFHVEATHVLGKGYYSFDASGADLVTFEGLPGTGCMFIRDGVEISPFILGGDEQACMRAGGLNFRGLLELGSAAREAVRFRDHFCMEIVRLRDRFEEMVGKPLFNAQRRVPHLSAHIFPGVTSDALLFLLQKRGVHLATFGGGRFQHMMHVLSACGIKGHRVHSGLSFSFSHQTTEEEVEQVAQKTLEVVEKLRGYSQYLLATGDAA